MTMNQSNNIDLDDLFKKWTELGLLQELKSHDELKSMPVVKQMLDKIPVDLQVVGSFHNTSTCDVKAKEHDSIIQSKKTLVFILNYGTPELSNKLYASLEPYKQDLYDLYILDNGSPVGLKCHGNHVLQLESNYYFGGALNIAFKYILQHPEYDSLLFMNSDLIVSPYNFVHALKENLNIYTIVSPCIIQPEGQCHWKTMHQWNSNKIRNVEWIDFQCPLIHRRFIDNTSKYDDMLNYGWGNDIYSGIICENNNWEIGVCDNVTAIHLDGYTTKKFKDVPQLSNYNKIAETNMFSYFNKIQKMDRLFDMRNYAEKYSYSLVS